MRMTSCRTGCWTRPSPDSTRHRRHACVSRAHRRGSFPPFSRPSPSHGPVGRGGKPGLCLADLGGPGSSGGEGVFLDGTTSATGSLPLPGAGGSCARWTLTAQGTGTARDALAVRAPLPPRIRAESEAGVAEGGGRRHGRPGQHDQGRRMGREGGWREGGAGGGTLPSRSRHARRRLRRITAPPPLVTLLRLAPLHGGQLWCRCGGVDKQINTEPRGRVKPTAGGLVEFPAR